MGPLQEKCSLLLVRCSLLLVRCSLLVVSRQVLAFSRQVFAFWTKCLLFVLSQSFPGKFLVLPTISCHGNVKHAVWLSQTSRLSLTSQTVLTG